MAMDIWQNLVRDIKFKHRAESDSLRDSAAGLRTLSKDIPASTSDLIEAANTLRKANGIRVQGTNVPAPLKAFEELCGFQRMPLPKAALPVMVQMHIQQPTAVQSQVLPLLMEGRDTLAIAPTGSGKTLAFLLPILAGLSKKPSQQKKPHALILAPTRELVSQTARVIEDLRHCLPSKLACACLTRAAAAGANFNEVDVLVTSPLRLTRLIRKQRISLSHISFLVLDEADKLLELKANPHTVSHVHQVDKIMAVCTNPSLVIGVFSATIPETVEALCKSFLKDPVRVTVGERNFTAENIKQQLQFAGSEEGKILLLQQLLTEGINAPVLIFVSSKEKAMLLQRKLVGYRVDSIFSNKEYSLRQKALDTFRSGETWLLISTDVLARGIDFVGIQTVINYDCPTSLDDYVHRIGRTGRRGYQGTAVTFFTEEDGLMVRSIAHMARSMAQSVPQWMLTMPKSQPNKLSKKRRKQ